MASLGSKGMDELLLSLEEIERIPDSVVDEMLLAGGHVVEDAHRASIRKYGLIDSRKLMDSVKVRRKIGRDQQRKVIVYPSGKRVSRHRKTLTKPVTNSEVGFVHEYGASRRNIPAKNWMSKANERCAAETTAAMYQVYDTWLKSLNL